MVKNLLAMQETQVLSLGWEDPLDKEMATHSSVLAWRIPWTEDLVGYNPWGCKGSDMTEATLRHSCVSGKSGVSHCQVRTQLRLPGSRERSS